MSHRDNLLDLLTACLDAAIQASKQMVGDFKQPAQRYACALFCTLIEYADTIIILAKERKQTAIPLVTRAAMDAFVDLKNLAEHATYWQDFEAADDVEWKRILGYASRGGNAFLHAIETDGILLDARKIHTNRLKKHESKGAKKLNARERYELAGMLPEYEAVHPFLSSDVHNSVTALVGRHFDLTGERPELVLFNQDGRFELSCLLEMSELLLHGATHTLRLVGQDDAVLTSARARHSQIVKSGESA